MYVYNETMTIPSHVENSQKYRKNFKDYRKLLYTKLDMKFILSTDTYH